MTQPPEPTSPETEPPAAAPGPEAAYRVLARKYRPARFAELIGQAALVRTLTNAINLDRLAHAYMLTGVRGVGKTTTARIIARALNCIGRDGAGGPTAEPCGVCESCIAITADRHIDVIEMDAASRTGVDDMRELIDGVRYRPLGARYKIYIIDEVHMLSKHAFNALLKTLEEPPAHVVFVFATTEVRKVPITVLSRCQRFDLRRVEAEMLAAYLEDIGHREDAALTPAALALLARAADGSVRDGLSLLDQAISTFGPKGDGDGIAEDQLRDMLGLADRTRIFDLFEALMSGDIEAALGLLKESHRAGADPLVVIQDLLELVHWVTRLKIVPDAGRDMAMPEAERVRGRAAAEMLAMPALSRAWQMLLKGLGEVQAAPVPMQAAEMVLVRLAYAAELPTPGEIVAGLDDRGGGGKPAPAPADAPPGPPRAALTTGGATAPRPTPEAEAHDEVEAAAPAPGSGPHSFEAVVSLFGQRREGILHNHLMGKVHLVRFEVGLIEFRPTADAPHDLANRLGQLLSEWTGRRWVVSVSGEPGMPTLNERALAASEALKSDARANPVVGAILETFPGAEITAVNEPGGRDDTTDQS
jgi:DNA polymerase-3 subunit gamma/tau